MKKSKIIIPALGVILLTTAASVSGTVAWFLATKDVKVSATNFKVTNIDGNLTVTAAAGVGTSVVASGSLASGVQAGIQVSANTELTDGSFDHEEKHATRLIKSTWDATNHTASYKDLGEAGSTWKVGESNDSTPISYYAAVSFSYTFEYTFSTNDNENLYFDWANSTLSATNEDASGTGATKNGFRIYMYTASYAILYSNHLADATPTYVPVGHTSTTGENYASTDVVLSANAASKTPIKTLEDKGTPSAEQGKLQIGQLTPSNPSLEVTCVAWFEGSDLTNVISGAKMATMAANLAFVARTAA